MCWFECRTIRSCGGERQARTAVVDPNTGIVRSIRRTRKRTFCKVWCRRHCAQWRSFQGVVTDPRSGHSNSVVHCRAKGCDGMGPASGSLRANPNERLIVTCLFRLIWHAARSNASVVGRFQKCNVGDFYVPPRAGWSWQEVWQRPGSREQLIRPTVQGSPILKSSSVRRCPTVVLIRHLERSGGPLRRTFIG